MRVVPGQISIMCLLCERFMCTSPTEQFMEFAGRHNVPLHYGADDLEEDRQTLERLGL